MAAMRILHLVGRSHRRGAEQVARELAAELQGRGHANRLLAVSLGHEGERTDDLHPLVEHAGQRPAQLLRAVWALRADLRRRPVDVVLAHGAAAAYVAALAAPAAGRVRPKVVWQTTSGLSAPSFGRGQRALWRLALPRIDGAVALTGTIGRELRDFGYGGPMWTIPNARRSDRFAALDRVAAGRALRAEIGVGPDEVLLGLVGYLVEVKQPADAVAVLVAVRAAGTDAHLVLAGAGPLDQAVRRAAADAGVGEHVTLLGHRDDVEQVLGAIDVLLLTSRFEGVPGVLVEAAMAGCPVVAYPVGEVGEVLVHGETGIIASEATPVVAAEAVGELLADEARRRAMGDAARARGAAFAMDVVAEQYEVHLAEVVASGPR